MIESFFPFYNDGNINDGLFSKCPKYCKNRMKKGKKSCLEFHKNFVEIDVTKICPDGFANYNTANIRYTSLIFKSDNVHSTYRKIDSERDIPIITQDAFESYIKNQYSSLAIENALRDTLHDVKKLNGFILDLLSQIQAETEIYSIVEPIHKWSLLTKSKLTFYDLTMNGLLLNQGRPIPKHPFKLFDALKKSFESISSEKNLQYLILSRDRFDFNIMVYESFQLIPFILLDNATKYSPNNEKVTISFAFDEYQNINIEIKSIGPKPFVEDLNVLFQKGYRDKSVTKENIQGSGLGLSIAKDICDSNKIGIRIEINDLDYLQQMLYPGYAYFSVVVTIANNKRIIEKKKK